MNIIAPVFAPENAAFASAHQDLILRAMIRATPLALRNNGWANESAKGKPGLRDGSVAHTVYNAMAEGEIYTISQLCAKTSLTRQQVSDGIRDLRRGYVVCKPRHSGQFNGYKRAGE